MGGFELKTKRSLLAHSEATRHHFGLASVIFIFFFIPFYFFFRDYYVQGIVRFVHFCIPSSLLGDSAKKENPILLVLVQ